MSDRITNLELKKIHSYMEELDQEEFVTLLHKLLTTFNFLVVNGREWKEKSMKYNLVDLELVEKKQVIITLKNRLKIRENKIKELEEELQRERDSGERYFNAYKSAIEREERLKKGISKLKNEIDHRGYTKN